MACFRGMCGIIGDHQTPTRLQPLIDTTSVETYSTLIRQRLDLDRMYTKNF